jgi:predicted HAD superfamily hydrolase
MKKTKLFTFDVFDTTITRSVAFPTGIFDIMQEKLSRGGYGDIPSYIRNNFGMLRKEIEAYARERKMMLKNSGNEVRLEDIYDCMMRVADLTREQIDGLIKLEMELEYTCSVGIFENIDIIKKLRTSGERVAFISDMYLSSAFIRSLICKHAPDFVDMPIYVSCEYDIGKMSGDLFRRVLEIERVNPDEVEHFGDNVDSDMIGSKKAGIASKLYHFEKLTSWEKQILKINKNAITQIAVGTARNARLNHKLLLSGRMGASYTAPLLFPYVFHILKKCAETNIQLLVFIARDGAILKEIADAIICNSGTEKFAKITTKLIYASRTVWYTEDEKKKEIATEYLLQELTDKGVFLKFAFVDLQGTGKSMKCVARMLRDYTNEAFDAFYMSISMPAIHKGYTGHSFFAKRTDFSEVLCRMPCGKTIGYSKKDGKIAPVFDSHSGMFDEFDYDEYKKGTICFCKTFNRVCEELDIEMESLQLCDAYLKYAVTEQRNEIMGFFGRMQFAFGDNQDDNRPYAIRPSKRELREMYLLREKCFEASVYCHSCKTEYVSLLYTPEDNKKIAFYEKHYNGWIGKTARLIYPKPKIKNTNWRMELLKELKRNNMKRLIIYGAGKVGKRTNEFLRNYKFKILMLADRDHENLTGISDPHTIPLMAYDAVIIAILDANVRDEVKTHLVALGVPSGKIIFAIK